MQSAGLGKALFHKARDGSDAALVALGNGPGSVFIGFAYSGGGKLQPELFDGQARCPGVRRQGGTGDEWCQATQGREAVAAESHLASAGRGSDLFEKRWLEMEGDAAVAFAMLVTAGEATAHTA